MTLDLSQVASQIEEMAAWFQTERARHHQRLEVAMATLHAQDADLDALRRRIDEAMSSGGFATPQAAGVPTGLGDSLAAPPCPGDFAILASDGSHIELDRHQPVPCHLINIGLAYLRYGSSPHALLRSTPELFFGEQADEPQGGHSGEGARLQARRAIAEIKAASDYAKENPVSIPLLVFVDGSLILWSLVGRGGMTSRGSQTLLEGGFLPALDDIRRAGPRVAVAAYISAPRSTEVINTLRLAICPYHPIDCSRHCRELAFPQRPCDALAGLQDQDLFQSLLPVNRRSAIFTSRAPIVSRYREHEVCFFYLRLENEIARVEVPRWVAEDEGLLGLTHAFTLDQCQRGYGYPVAIAEAHEQAVVTGADREHFWGLVGRTLYRRRLPATTSAKSRSKRTRWL